MILDFQVEFVAYTAVNASIALYSSKTWVKIVDKDVSSLNELLIANPLELSSSELRTNFPLSLLLRILMAKLYLQRVIEAGHPQTTNLGSLQASAQAYASLIAGVLVGQEISGKRA